MVLVVDERSCGFGVGRERQDPQVANQVDPALAESDLVEPLDVPGDLGRKEPLPSRCEVPQEPLRVAKLADATGQASSCLTAARNSSSGADRSSRTRARGTPDCARVRILMTSMTSCAV